MKYCFEQNKTRILKFQSTSSLFEFVFDNNSDIHSTQQKVRKPGDLKLNSLKQINKKEIGK